MAGAGGSVVLATGAIERPLVFPGNDRPGIMLASAARTYLNRYGVAVGQNVVLVTGSDAAYAAALDLHAAGVRVAADRRCARGCRPARRSTVARAGGHRGRHGRDRARHPWPAAACAR